MPTQPSGPRTAIVRARHEDSDGIVVLQLGAVGDDRMPSWAPGDHIDVATPSGLRQYSLCGEREDPAWTIAVLREPDGRGGSRWLHDEVHSGTVLEVGAPRSSFAVRPAAERLLVAGGIGITALLPIAERAEATGERVRLVHLARRAHPLRHRVERLAGGELVTTAEQGRPDLLALLAAHDERTEVACCGPTELIDGVLAAADALGRGHRVAVERFVAAASDTAADTAFELELAGSGRVLQVPADRTALDVLAEAGVFVPSSCREGLCGSCETGVLGGAIDHRDSILDDAERAAGDCFFPCVSRAQGARIVIDR